MHGPTNVKFTFVTYYILVNLNIGGVSSLKDGINDAAACTRHIRLYFMCQMRIWWCYE
jgi:hypothetical protein